MVTVGVLQNYTQKNTFLFLFVVETVYNNLQPKLLKAGSITFFFMLQDFRKWNGDRKG